MQKTSSEYIADLTNDYLTDPTPENAQRLWLAVFSLEGWYVILRGNPENPMPYAGSHDGKSFLAVWTDSETLNAYIDASNLQPSSGDDIQYMFVPLPDAVDYLMSFEHSNLDGVRFNLPLGWAVTFPVLQYVGRQIIDSQ